MTKAPAQERRAADLPEQPEQPGQALGAPGAFRGKKGAVPFHGSAQPAPVADNGGMYRDIVYALLAAALFGASTPFAKLLTGEVSPVLLGGLLYLASGLGLTLVRLVRDRGWK
ncbi:MAG: hypothetical protein ABI845_02615, partial [Polaromonas sp.]